MPLGLKSKDFVVLEMRIVSANRQAFSQGLGKQHSIKRILMVWRKLTRRHRVLGSNRKLAETILAQRRH